MSQNMALMPGKLFAKSCTKMTLHERFTGYREQASAQSNTFRDRVLLQQKQASAENRRLAQQMANRPSVIAALKLKKKSMQQRLGQKRSYQAMVPVKARLNLGFRSPQQRVQNRLGRGKGLNRNNRGVHQNNAGFNRPGTSPLLKARLGLPKSNQRKFGQRGFGSRRNFSFAQKSPVKSFKRGGGKGGRGGQSFRGGRPRGGGGGRQNNWINRGIPTKTELDHELDQYMAETKSGSGQYLNY